eukprot:scaffold7945_cov92-Amphora_coffeaeformis.AAC.1
MDGTHQQVFRDGGCHLWPFGFSFGLVFCEKGSTAVRIIMRNEYRIVINVLCSRYAAATVSEGSRVKDFNSTKKNNTKNGQVILNATVRKGGSHSTGSRF